jgi:sucrose-6-phosphate hydrolase SacC (GH32 family)
METLMNQAYLFVHFKEKETPDGEQVYFGLSQDGFHWEETNGGEPILTSTIGEQGVRDFTILRKEDGTYCILATDLSLARNFKTKYKSSWDEVGKNGSKSLVLWQSSDLIHWSEPKSISFVDESFGCVWAPDIIRDEKTGEYIIHWSSSHSSNHYGPKKIYGTRTRDFEHFTQPFVLFERGEIGIIDSAMYQENGRYYLFVKSEADPETILLLESDSVTGPFTPIPKFSEEMKKLEQGQYEAPTAFRTEDGRWCLFLDFYGTVKEKQGYIPFVSDDIHTGRFIRSDESFFFPYGFKHGTVLTLTNQEYERLKKAYL